MNKAEFEQIVPELRRLALEAASGFRCRSEEAEDAVQDSLVELYLMRSDIHSPTDAQRLVRILTRRKLIDQWRRQAAHPSRDVSRIEPLSYGRLPDETLEEKELQQWLDRQISRLPRTEHRILRLRQDEQLSNEQIAALLGTTPASVATLLSRCRQRLLKVIANK